MASRHLLLVAAVIGVVITIASASSIDSSGSEKVPNSGWSSGWGWETQPVQPAPIADVAPAAPVAEPSDVAGVPEPAPVANNSPNPPGPPVSPSAPGSPNAPNPGWAPNAPSPPQMGWGW